MKLKVGDRYRIKHVFGPHPQGYLVHIVAIVDEDYIVYKYYGRCKQYWHYGVKHIGVFKIWLDRSIENI